MTNYESYARKEMSLINVPEFIQELVGELLRTIDKEGHSGGSISVFSNMVRGWLENLDEQDFEEDSLIKPLFEIIKRNDSALKELNWSWEQLITMMRKVMMFNPLSPLTGEDSEWNECTLDGGFQNNRFSSVFKDRKEGKAYWSDGRVFCEPQPWGWSGWISRDSKVNITFPFTVPDKPEYVYYVDESRQMILPEGIDPMAYIKIFHDKTLLCRDPLTNIVDENFLFFKTEVDVNRFVDLAKRIMFGEHAEYNRKWLISHARYYRDNEDIHYTEKLKGLEKDFVLNPFEFNTLARLALRLNDKSKIDGIAEHNWFELDGKSHLLFAFKVCSPTKNYQGWKPNGWYVLDWKNYKSINDDEVYYDKPFLVFGDADSHLLQKRRDLNLAHPKRKPRRLSDDTILQAKIEIDEPDPMGAVQATQEESLSTLPEITKSDFQINDVDNTQPGESPQEPDSEK